MSHNRSNYQQVLTEVYEEVIQHVELGSETRTPDLATVTKRVATVRPLLIGKASELGGDITYTQLVEESGTNRNYLGVVLGAIGHCEYRLGNPNLSALVVNSDTPGPAGGFFNWSYIPDRLQTSRPEGRSLTPEEDRFWKAQMAEVRAHDWEPEIITSGTKRRVTSDD